MCVCVCVRARVRSNDATPIGTTRVLPCSSNARHTPGFSSGSTLGGCGPGFEAIVQSADTRTGPELCPMFKGMATGRCVIMHQEPCPEAELGPGLRFSWDRSEAGGGGSFHGFIFPVSEKEFSHLLCVTGAIFQNFAVIQGGQSLDTRSR